MIISCHTELATAQDLAKNYLCTTYKVVDAYALADDSTTVHQQAYALGRGY